MFPGIFFHLKDNREPLAQCGFKVSPESRTPWHPEFKSSSRPVDLVLAYSPGIPNAAQC